MRILVLFAHPRPSASVVQKALAAAARSVEGVTVRDLYAEYPQFGIDVAREQELLLAHELIVLQHPFYWYSSPAILKEWQDLVLEFGWAYGPGGQQLHGKYLMQAISTGGAAAAYQPSGRNRFTIDEFLRPFNQTAHLCGMAYLKPFVVHEGRQIERTRLEAAAADYRALLDRLAHDAEPPLSRVLDGYPLPAAFATAEATSPAEAAPPQAEVAS
jgi:glutathione-regulated potassium-efflux system ancillary protein KefG